MPAAASTSGGNSKQRLSFSPTRRGHASSSSPVKHNFPEQLVAFSSMPAMELPFRYTQKPALDTVGAVLWKQLLARWKHTETITALHLSDHGATEDDGDDEWSEEGSLPEPIRQELELQGMTLPSATSARAASVEAAVVHYLSTVVQWTPVSAMSPRHAREDAATIFQQASSLKIPLKEWMQAAH